MSIKYQKNVDRRYKGATAKLVNKRLAVTDCAALEMLSFPLIKGTVLAVAER